MALALVCVGASWLLVALNPLKVVLIVAAIVVSCATLNQVGFWIFATYLMLMLVQTHFLAVHLALEQVRWIPFFYFGLLALVYAGAYRRLPRSLHLFDGVMLIWLGFIILSSLDSISPSLTVQRAGTLVLMYVAVFWAIWAYVDQNGEDRCVSLLLRANVLVQALNWMFLLASPGEAMLGGRLRGIVGNPNNVGWITAMLFPLALHRVLVRRERGDYAVLILMALSLLLSASRGAMVGVALGSTYVLWKARSEWLWYVVGIGVWIGLSLGGVAPMPSGFGAYARVENLSSGAGRLEAWPIALLLIQQRPWSGFGFGTEDLLLSPGMYSFEEFQGGYFHNAYLGLTVQIGVLGATFFFVALWSLAIAHIWKSRRDPDLHTRHAFLAVLLVGLTACFFESWIYSMGNALAFPFWVVVMLLIREHALTRSASVGEPVEEPATAIGGSFPAPAWGAS